MKLISHYGVIPTGQYIACFRSSGELMIYKRPLDCEPVMRLAYNTRLSISNRQLRYFRLTEEELLEHVVLDMI